jgi:nitrogen-specific signal transduction histidine kinase/CheY-like chemotaxis protein
MSERQRAEKEKETLQRQLNQAQKLESLGTLAGGIAHDFNNLLTPIIGFTELLKYKFTPETLEWNNLQEIAKAGQRAKELVKQMLAFGRPGPQTLEPVALNHVVEDCLVLLRAGLPTTVEIHTTLESVYGTVLADPTQLHQVVMNLSVNALHAMEGQVGTLSIAVEQTIVDAAFATLHPPLVPGRYQKLIVRDTGSGIPPAVLPSIFDPFFTTKPIGKGSGLGLAVVHGIVTSFGGAIVVDSVFGKGTTFTIYLPLSDSEETIAADESQPLAQGRGRILIVDDDPTVMLLTTQMLETLGYDVTPVPDSQKALDQFRLTPHQFDMVMTDQLMPGLRGTDLAIAVRALHPTIPIVICSGSNTEMPETLLSVPGKATWLKKPFTLDQLGLTLQGIA